MEKIKCYCGHTDYCDCGPLPIATTIHEQEAQYNRSAYIELVDDKVVFDCSDGEYGPITFNLDVLLTTLEEHTRKQFNNKK